MSIPPQTTVFFEDGIAGTGSDSWLVGIDLLFFTVTKLFYGIKNISAGVHFLHYSKSESTLRYGLWFECEKGDIIVLKWDKDDEKFKLVRKETPAFATAVGNLCVEQYALMTNYPAEEGRLWKCSIINYVDLDILLAILPGFGSAEELEIGTIVASQQESNLLKEVLNKLEKTTIAPEETVEEGELVYTPIEFKVSRPNEAKLTPEQVTKDYLDKSWYVEQIYPDREYLLGEFQVSFVHYVVVGNYCSMAQWLNIFKLLLMSSSLMLMSKTFSFNFFGALQLQLARLPREYLVGGEGEQILIDLEVYVLLMENYIEIFRDWDASLCCGKLKFQGMIKQRFNEILALHKQSFDMDFSNIANLQQDDEDQPVIVGYVYEKPAAKARQKQRVRKNLGIK